MFLIRQARPRDFSGVYPLAQILNSYNLPADRGYVRDLLSTSELSFQGRLPKPKARYLFVLEEKRTGKIVGCSLIIAKHGTPGHPHLWLSLKRITQHSRTLGIRRSHQILQLGYTENGPTEVGGFVVLPSHRKRSQRCGLQLSYARLLYMAIHPERFEKKVLVEYRGIAGAHNQSPFWEALGRLFTGLPYAKADHLSVTNKEFIKNLWPHTPIYCALLPESVQKAIGAIHPAASRAARLLQTVGFKPIAQIEPFDGGPYYVAPRSQIRIVQQTRRFRVVSRRPSQSHLYLVGTEGGGSFRAVLVEAQVSGGSIGMKKEDMKILNVENQEPVYACPISR